MGFFDCVELLRKGKKTFSFLVMRKNLFGSFGFASVLFATALVGFDAQVALACSGGGSSGSGLSHGSSIGSRSVTVCVGSSGQSSGSSSTQTITKTVTVKVPVEKKPAPKKAPQVVAKPAPKPAPKPAVVPAPVSCPSSAQLASMPRSADAAERWVASVCSPPAKTTAAPKPAPQVSAKPKQQFETRTITETITIDIPGSSYSSNDEADFYPNELKAVMAPLKVLGIGQSATFSSNGVAHYGISQILGRQAQVHFVPLGSGWSFSDGMTRSGADTSHSFQSAGKYQVQAWVKYQVSYRLLGETNWQPVAGQLTVDSNVLEVLVGALYLKGDEAGQGALLVGSDCLEKTKAFGCGI
jgi:hypothetical protein